jgi:two-component system, LuxR family, sensor kinase FixL
MWLGVCRVGARRASAHAAVLVLPTGFNCVTRLVVARYGIIDCGAHNRAGKKLVSDRLTSRGFELQALLDAAVDAVIIINHGGIIEVFNHSATRLFGYAPDEVLGRNVKMLMTGADVERHDSYLEQYLRTGITHIIGTGREVLGRRKDGSLFPAFLSVGRIAGSDPPRFVGFIQDVTLRHQTLLALQRESGRANQYLEAAQTMLVALDLTHRVTLINRKGCEVLGCDDKTLLGADWFDRVVPSDQRGKAGFEMHALVERTPRRPHHCEYSVMATSGELRLIAWRCVALQDDTGAVTGILCSGDDVTDSRRAEKEATETRERMMHVSRLATMGEMASGISHELNQPLTAIANYAQACVRLLASPGADLADVREALTQISGQALRAGEIIRRLRALVRKQSTQREQADINELIKELDALARADARSSDVRVILNLGADLPYVSLDRVQIQQVLLNLLRNSIDSLESIRCGHRDVIIRTGTSSDGDVFVEIADSGAGIAADVLPHLFTPFATNKPQGTGLGLAISRTIVEAHNGRLEYLANKPRGAVFIVTLPREQGLPG